VTVSEIVIINYKSLQSSQKWLFLPLSIIGFLYHPKAAGFCSLQANADLLLWLFFFNDYYILKY